MYRYINTPKLKIEICESIEEKVLLVLKDKFSEVFSCTKHFGGNEEKLYRLNEDLY